MTLGFLGGVLIAIALWVAPLWFLGTVAMVPLFFYLLKQKGVGFGHSWGGGFYLGFFYFLLGGFPLLSIRPSFSQFASLGPISQTEIFLRLAIA
ncbi:MAG: hypothetical protein Q8Q41_04590, partial [bacterium]|nr:hypothetical protein [bacterium]